MFRKQNVTLYCETVRGNPSRLNRVKWFMDDLLLTELPQCSGTQSLLPPPPPSAEDPPPPDDTGGRGYENLCGIDPSKLILEYVNREFAGRYSCVGVNEVGASPASEPVRLQILFPPGEAAVDVLRPAAAILHNQIRRFSLSDNGGRSMTSTSASAAAAASSASPTPPHPVLYKNSLVNLTCRTSDLGNPPATEYIWLIGNTTVEGTTGPTWQLDPVVLGSRAELACLAYNVVGRGGRGPTRRVEVLARPRFLRNLPPATGTVSLSAEINLVCQVNLKMEQGGRKEGTDGRND